MEKRFYAEMAFYVHASDNEEATKKINAFINSLPEDLQAELIFFSRADFGHGILKNEL